jgi:hypothetical protein
MRLQFCAVRTNHFSTVLTITISPQGNTKSLRFQYPSRFLSLFDEGNEVKMEIGIVE